MLNQHTHGVNDREFDKGLIPVSGFDVLVYVRPTGGRHISRGLHLVLFLVGRGYLGQYLCFLFVCVEEEKLAANTVRLMSTMEVPWFANPMFDSTRTKTSPYVQDGTIARLTLTPADKGKMTTKLMQPR